jgi:alkanesulfonate monooxygenase SsuD/methylene tetrahydromethanopterin reductase-like flavin-dependent oxidoreductase (luciferase family)
VTVRFGLYLPAFGPLADPVALVELARRAESAGWDGVFLWEHVLADGPMADEALDVISAVWAGRAHVSAGHYTADIPAGEQEPHRIPVWVAATMPEVRSAHRAARFDGAVL